MRTIRFIYIFVAIVIGSNTFAADFNVAIASSESDPTNASPIPVTITFDVSVADFIESDISVTNGSISNFSGSGTEYTMEITPGGEGEVTVDVPAGVATNGADQNLAGTFSIDYDITPPSIATAVISSGSGTMAVGGSLDITVTEAASETGLTVTSATINSVDVSGTFSDNTDGSYTFTYVVNEGDADQATGSIPFSIQLEDTAGNRTGTQTSYTTANTVGVDANTPSSPGTADLADGSDNGVSSSDNLTNVTTPTFNGAGAEVGSTVRIYSDQDGMIGSGSEDGSGNWSIATSITTIGSHNITATATDAAGNESLESTSALTITIDITPSSITSTNFPSSPPKYEATDILSFDLNWDENVYVSGGIPSFPIILDEGGTKAAEYTGGSGTQTLTFEYTVVSGDKDDPSGIEVTGLIALNGATVNDISGNDAELVFTGGSTSIKIDAKQPGITDVVVPDNGYYSDTETLDFYVTFNKVVTVSGVPYIPVTLTSGSVTADYTSMTDNGTTSTLLFRYAVSTGDIDLNGIEIGTDIVLTGGATIKEGKNNAFLTLTGVDPLTGILVDAVLPTLTSVGIVSDNGNSSGTYAREGEQITLSFTGSETLAAKPTVTIAGNAIASGSVTNPSGNNWEAVYLMGALDAEGVVPFTIDFTDLAGNTNSPVTATTNSSSVTYFRTQPTLASVSIASNHTNPNSANTGSLLTIAFSSDRELDNVTVSIFGSPAAVSNVGDLYNWTANYTTQSGDIEGPVPFSIDFYDMPLNQGDQVSATTDGSSVIFDKTPPQLNSVTIKSDNTNSEYVGDGGTVTLSVTGSEGLENSPVVAINGHTATVTKVSGSSVNWRASYVMGSAGADSDGNVAFTVDFVDFSGNNGVQVAATTDGSTVTFDQTPPTLLTVSISSNNSNNSSFGKPGDEVIISFTSDDDIENVSARIGSEAKSMVVSSTSGTEWSAEYTLPSTGLTEGALPMSISFQDYAGNQVTHGSGTTDGSSVTFDKSAPLAPSKPDLRSDYGISATDNITYEINPEFFGTAESYTTVRLYSNVNGLIGTVTASDTSTFQVFSSTLDQGTHIITATATDGPGNVSAVSSSLTITIDNTPPAKPGTPEMDAGSDTGILNNDNITSDNTPTIAGISETNCLITVYSGALLLGTANADIFGVWSYTTPILAEGDHSITVHSTDASGNTGPVSDLLTITIDTNAPDAPGVPDLMDGSDNGFSSSDNITNHSTLTFTGTSEEGAAIQLYSDLDGLIGTGTANGMGTWVITSGLLSSAAYAITVAATDVSGNVSPFSPVLNITIDTDLPTYSLVSIYSDNHNPTFAVDGDQVSVEFSTSEAVETPEVFINGRLSDVITGGPVNWVATRTVTAGEDEGTIPFTIHISDLAGNTPNNRFTTTDGTAVVFDDSNPGISSITVTSGVYQVGDVISLLIRSDDITYTGTTVEVNGKPQLLNNNLNNNYTIDYLIEEGDAELYEAGSVPVVIVLQDPAGLTTSRTEAASLMGTITIDSRTPRISTFSSNAEGSGNVIIGDSIIFTLMPETAETGLHIQPVSYNGAALNWATTDGVVYKAIYVVQESDPEQTSPLQLSQVILSDDAGNADTMVYAGIGKQIYTAYPSAKITGSTSKCDYGQTVPIIFQFTGRKPFTFSYSNGTDIIGPIVRDGFTYTINEDRGSFTLVSLTDSTGNNVTDALENAVIDVISLPVVTTDYFNSPYNIESPADKLSQYVVQEDKRNGIFSAAEGIGYSNGSYYFYPGNIPAGLLDKDIEIIYTYTDGITGCFTKDTSRVFVSSTPVRIVGLQSVYCEDIGQVTIGGTLPAQHSGRFEVFDADSNLVVFGWTQSDSVTLTFDTRQLPAGDYIMKYTAYKLPDFTETKFSSTRDFSIEAIRRDIQLTGLSDAYCFDSLSSSIPVRVNFEPGLGDIGHFFGSDVFTVIPGEHNARFELRNAKANNIYTLNYIYKSINGCIADTVSRTVQINPLPELAFELDNNYNYDQTSIQLSGTPEDPKYNFTGEGVSNNTLFTSAARINSSIVITFSGSDDKGCYNEVIDTTIIYQANETIEGISAEGVYCYEELVLDISCSPNICDTITGTFRSKRNALEPDGRNRAKYYFNRIGSGADTVYFDYDVLGTSYTVKKAVFIDSIGEVSITSSTADFDYCHSEPLVQYVGNQNYTLGGQGEFKFVGSNGEAEITRSSSTAIYPVNEVPGTYAISYSYTTSRGCSAETSHMINIYPEPVTDFSQPISCPDLTSPVPFTNHTTFSGDESKLGWEWRFEGGLPVIEKNPVYTFQSIGVKQVSLTVTTDKGCAVSKSREYTIGNFAQADFKWDNECNTGEQVTLTSTSKGGIPKYGGYIWKMEGTVISEERTAVHQFSDIGEYDIRLVYTSNDGCIDSVTKTLVIVPYIRITEDFADQTYFEDFESGSDLYTWQTRGLTRADTTRTDTTRWNLGVPEGDVISTASGNYSWYTRLIDRTDVENSEVVSPCFDLSGLEKPMIKLNIWSSSEFKRDGAVMQYSTDYGNGWDNLGDVNEGVNWFNSEDIQSQPGGLTQYEGWNDVRMEGWTSARHSLDFLKGATNVRFRIAYAADGGGVEDVDGFAFDDVWIGERQQNVLMEYFTNSNASGIVEGNSNMLDFEASRVADLVPIHYHTGSPSGDPLFSDYEEGPSARVFYYGVSFVPEVISNGLIRSGLDNKAVDLFNQEVDVESLNDPLVSIDLNVSHSSVEVNITALRDLTGESMALFIAVVRDSIEVDGIYYYNVLRKFLPDPAGINLFTNGFTNGETITESVALNTGSSSMLIGSKLVAFVQNSRSKRVYQSVWSDLSGLTSRLPDNINKMVDIYPNPVTDRLVIESEYEIRRLVITDMTGRVVRIMEPDQVRVDLPVEEYRYGVYMIKGITDRGEFIKKFIKY